MIAQVKFSAGEGDFLCQGARQTGTFVSTECVKVHVLDTLIGKIASPCCAKPVLPLYHSSFVLERLVAGDDVCGKAGLRVWDTKKHQ
jgi:hypothetical protein